MSSEPLFDVSLVEDLANYRRVSWDGKVPHDGLSAALRNTLGAIQTLFRLSEECAAELEQLARTASPVAATQAKVEDAITAEQDLLEDLAARSHEFIKHRLSNLPWDDMERLVAGPSCAPWATRRA